MLKWLIGLGVAFVLIVAGLSVGGYFFLNSAKGKEMMLSFRPGSKPKEVRLVEVERGQLIKTVSAPGVIEPETNIKISAQVSARIIALPFRAGDQVRAGDVVCRLDAVDLKARVDAAQARLMATRARVGGVKAELMRAQSEFGRARELFDAGDTPRSDLERAEAIYLQALSSREALDAEILSAEADVVASQKDLDNAVISSPIDGVLTTLNAEVGELVVVGTLNTPGSVIMEIADLSRMLLKAQVDETNIKPVKPGQRARIYTPYDPDGELTGTVGRINLKREVNQADGTGYFEVEIRVDVPEGTRLLSGLTANTEIEVEIFDGVLKIPSQAVLDRRVDELPKDIADASAIIDRTKTYARIVFVERAGKALAKPVSIGPSDLTHTVILAGLDQTDRVVAGPFRELTSLKNDVLIIDEAEAAAKREADRLAKQGAKKPAAPAPADTASDTQTDATASTDSGSQGG
ncbi:MAG: efflux RND transporter periplasmic adaptor subunit [Phycisphaeraceae bacterium]|nr:efflux RND transporter periplasmic adaptor subunit [Phycisphaeraceae bacterium]